MNSILPLSAFMPSASTVHPSDLVARMRPGDLRGVRVCFINMPLRESAKPNTPPAGPGILAARLRQYGAEPTIIDLNAYRIKDETMRSELANGRHLSHSEAERLICDHFERYGEPHVIGLSGKITTLRWQAWTAATCRRLVPDAFIISGGGLATEFKAGLFNWIPELDAIGHSEGDDIILIAVSDIKQERQARGSARKSPYYVGEVNGRDRWIYHGNRPYDPVGDPERKWPLDHLPFPAWDLLERDVHGNTILEWYIKVPVWGLDANNSSATPFTMRRSLTDVSSRGCPHACGFCYRGAQGERNWGIRSPQNLREEAEWLIETYGVDFIGYNDDNFAVDRRRCQALPEAFADLEFRWGTHTRLDECTMDRLEPMAEAGCIYIGVGAESAARNTLIRMKKGGQILRKGGVERMTTIGGFEFPTMMIEGIKNCRKVGIHTNATWIMGYPGETLEDLKTSVAFILWQQELYTGGLAPGTSEHKETLASVNRRMFTATAYPGTELFRDPDVTKLLTEHFGITFDRAGDPICDENMRWYVNELDDATKVLFGKDGEPLNFSAMPQDVFLQARHYVDSEQTEEILEM